MAQEEAQQKLYNNAKAQSPSNKSLLWAFFMKQNLRFGLVQNLLFFCFFKTSFSCIYLILGKEVLNIQFLGKEINVGPGKKFKTN